MCPYLCPYAPLEDRGKRKWVDLEIGARTLTRHFHVLNPLHRDKSQLRPPSP